MNLHDARHLYFAYGSNLCPGQMLERCPGARPIGPGWLEGYRLVFPRPSARWKGGVAGWTPAPNAQLEGMLYSVSSVHLETLDRLEGVAEGRYRRTLIRVRLAGGDLQAAFSYEATPDARGPHAPTAAYLKTMIRGARHHGLTPEWIEELERLLAEAAEREPNPAGGSSEI